MPNIKQITIPNGAGTQTFDIVDQGARELIAGLSGSTQYLGVTTTELVDNVTTNPSITVGGSTVTASAGGIVTYGSKEFIYSGTVWQEFGDLSALGDLAFSDTASGSVTPTGSVTVSTNATTNKTATVSKTTGTATYTPEGSVESTFTGASMTSTGTFTPAGSVSLTNTNKTATVSKASSGTTTYTPEGSVSKPNVNITPSTTTVNSITNVGTLPTLTMTVANENLSISFSQGTLPTKGSDTSVMTGATAALASTPSFTGTAVRLVTDNIAVPSSASFSGTQGNVSVSGTTTGSVSSDFTGTGARLVTGNIAVPNTYTATFTGDAKTVTVSPD